MMQYSTEQLITTIALPTITILLIWTLVIFHKNRKKWGPYDIPIVCILVLSIIRNMSVLSYLLINALADPSHFFLEYCSVVVWIFNSVHTFQASSLTTIAIIGLFSVKLYRKNQNVKLFLTPTHIVYHLFCLTTLCACVGVAAVLAQNVHRDSLFRVIPQTVFECKFMPFNLDIKFNIFILVLHMFLSVISFTSFIIICYNYCQAKGTDFNYIKKSNSDLSDLSLENTINNENKNYYDSYTIQRGQNESNNFYPSDYCGNRDMNWNSDLSNMSTTVSSVNSKRPCLERSLRERQDMEGSRTGLETIHPVLIVCYLFYHLPIIVLCIYPDLIFPWPVTGIALWLGLVQDVLIPVGLGIVDSRFCKWVSSVYRCSSNVEEKLPHVGLVGKFRPFGLGSQPQSLEIQNSERNLPVFQAVEHRFPITNGSLYTSIDGRLPVIHNYRRNNKDNRRCTNMEKHQANVAFHSALLSHRHDHIDNSAKFPSCSNCIADLCPSHSNLHHLSTSYINKQLNQLNQFNGQLNPNHQFKPNQLNPTQFKPSQLNSTHQFKPGGQLNVNQFNPGQLNILQLNMMNQKSPIDRVSHSQESLHTIPDVENSQLFFRNSDMKLNVGANSQAVKNSRNLMRLNKMRLSRSEDSLNELQGKDMGNIIQANAVKKPESKRSPPSIPKPLTPQIKIGDPTGNEIYSSDDEYVTDINENFDSMSSKSCYSITTEANCDFDFFHSNNHQKASMDKEEDHTDGEGYYIINNVNNRPVITSVKPVNEKDSPKGDLKNFRIRRSNSKRSLEDFQAFIEVEENLKNNNNNTNRFTLQRSSSYMTLEDRRKIFNNDKFFRSSCKESDHPQFHVYRQKVKSEEYLPNTTTVYIEDTSGCFQKTCDDKCDEKCTHSVSDLKKVFISEYI